jgi:NAD-dependent deacetylase
MEQHHAIQTIRSRLQEARIVTVLTGAGVSAESGIPTFRGADGIWRRYNAVDLATPQAFARDPKLVWEFYTWRRDIIAKAAPNPAHYALAELERRKPGFTLITQNVDGLHRRAGSVNVIEIHGTLWRLRCTGCGALSENYEALLPDLPRCESCGGLLRPDVVWFGEALDGDLLNRALDALKSCQVMLVVGTSAVVQPAASFALYAKDAGAFVAEINLERTAQSGLMDAVLSGPAGALLPLLVATQTSRS